jgi:hypothetical protein
MRKLWTCDRYEDWGEPFRRVTLTGRTHCRLCDERGAKKVFNIQRRQGLNFNPRADHGVKRTVMKKGEAAVRMVTHCGPAGTAYICIPCAEALLENLKREVKK